MLITSRRNERVKEIAALKEKKFRLSSGTYLVEGVKMVRDAFSFGQTVLTVVGTEAGVIEFTDSGAEILTVTDEVMRLVCDEVSPQKVAAVVRIPRAKPNGGVSIILDGVSDSGNVGTIMRVAACCGISDLYMIGCADPYSPKAVRSSMSGVFRVNPIKAEYSGLDEIIGDRELLVADMGGENALTAEAKGDFCLALGSEAHGVGSEIKKLASRMLGIPMRGGMDSLNVGVSAGIILYSLMKDRF